MNELVSAELADDPTIDITTTGVRSGRPRRIEIWMLAEAPMIEVSFD